METSPHQTLGCECDSPRPKSPGSALCAECGLIYLTSEQYTKHLARCRAEVAALLEPTAEPEPAQPVTKPEFNQARGREPRSWLKRRRSSVAVPAG